MTYPIGITLNNPGNLEVGGPVFIGQCGTQGKWLKFIDPVHGLRAIIERLRAYQISDGDTTWNQMIGRYAPPSDNNPTSAYAANVAKACGMDADTPVDFTDPAICTATMKAITLQENGIQPYSDLTIQRAVSMVLAPPSS
jgi:hypothetical protein